MVITAGSTLNDRYHLDHKLGEGGFAQVFLGTDMRLRRRVAVKVLNPEMATQSDFLRRFDQEAQRIAELDHPNILSVFDYGEAERTVYLVMPYIEGGSLAEKLHSNGRLSLQETANYLQQAAAALDFAHGRNIVHRDVKPQNMLLRDNGNRLLLADFGIARVLSSAAGAQTRTGVMGTIAYMAPEQFQGNVGRTTDIYALGCMIFQMLTGNVPYSGSTEQIMFGHVMGAIPSLVERSQGQLPLSIQTVIEKALAKQPTDRFQSAGEFSWAFQEMTSQSDVRGRYSVPSQQHGSNRESHPDIVPDVVAPPRTQFSEPKNVDMPPTLPAYASSPPQGQAKFSTQDIQVLLSSKNAAWKVLNLWWILLTLPMGFLTWAAFLYIGIRVRRPRWMVWAVVYFAMLALAIAVSNVNNTLLAILLIFMWFGGIVHAIVVAKPFLWRLISHDRRPSLQPRFQ